MRSSAAQFLVSRHCHLSPVGALADLILDSAAELPDLTTNGGFSGISALDADTAVAVGVDYSFPVEDSRFLIEWDGTSWTRAEQDGGTHTAWLAAVDLAPDGGGWTVGSNQTGSPFEGNYVSTDYIERRTCG